MSRKKIKAVIEIECYNPPDSCKGERRREWLEDSIRMELKKFDYNLLILEIKK